MMYASIGVYVCEWALFHDVLNAYIYIMWDRIECMSIRRVICMGV